MKMFLYGFVFIFFVLMFVCVEMFDEVVICVFDEFMIVFNVWDVEVWFEIFNYLYVWIVSGEVVFYESVKECVE